MGLLPLAERVGKTALNRFGVDSRWVETSIGRLHLYEATGTGPLPTIVLLHGICSSGLPYAPLLQLLRRRARRVFIPEAPGHGWSDAPTSPLTPENLFAAMGEMLDRSLGEPAIVVGNSLGGAVALNYALSSAERVRGLVLTSPAGASMQPGELDQLLGAFRLRSRADAHRFLSRLYHRVPWFAPLLTDDLVRQFARDHIVSLTTSVRHEHAFTPEQLSALSMPVLLIWGRSDRLMPSANLDYFRAHLPAHARIEEPEGMGHCPHIDAPRAIADKIASFAESAGAWPRRAADNGVSPGVARIA